MHEFLCKKAAAWLRSRARCEPVFSRIASCKEVPDAIGWTSNYKFPGQSIVIECKATRPDFLRDAKKYKALQREDDAVIGGSTCRHSARNGKDRAFWLANGYKEIDLPRMGGHRYYLSPLDVVKAEDVASRAPDHGLLHWDGKRIVEVISAPYRPHASFADEVRYLRFALIHLSDNLGRAGVSIDLEIATKFFGSKGVSLPSKIMEVA